MVNGAKWRESLCICIAARLKMHWLMKTRNKTPTAGVLIRLLVSKPGKSSHNGSGTCVLS